jgi:hypothetical protein
MKPLNRRSFIQTGSGALGTLLLQGLASGLPPAYLLNPTKARAQAMPDAYQTLILSTSSKGDPLNVNCPGSYGNGITNNPNLPTGQTRFGGIRHRAAQVWCDLPNTLRQRLAFFHYNPRTAAHPEYRLTMAMRGSIKNEMGNGTEMFSSAMSQMAYSPGMYLQEEPIPLCDSFITFRSQPLQSIDPVSLKALFSPADQALADLRQTRDQVLDTLYADMKVNGNKAQREFVDRYANSRQQARELGERMGDLLNELPVDPDELNSAEDQIIAAVALAELRISPVITINIPFGGDNHQDTGLIREQEQTVSGVEAIGSLWTRLQAANIQNQVTFATMNVFGRRAYLNSRGGRDHNRYHALMVAFGHNVQGGVYGGMDSEGKAVAIGNIEAEETMEAAGFSLARALGYTEDAVARRIHNGRIVDGFLRS